MLAIVDEVAGLRVGEGICASAEGRLALQHGDAEPTLRQRHARAEAGEAAADDNDVFRLDRHGHIVAWRHRAPAHARPTRYSLRGVESRSRRSKTRYSE